MHNAIPNRVSASCWCGLFALAGGLLVLVGWAGDFAGLKSVLPGLPAMKANAAVCFMLTGASLVLLSRAGQSAGMRRAAQLCAGAAALLGLLTFVEYHGINFGIDQLLFREPAGAIDTVSPGRMAPTSALSFLLLGSALVLIARRRALVVAQWVALVAGLLGFLSLLSLLYHVLARYGLGISTHMALHTAVLFVLLGLGVWLLHPAEGLMQPFTSKTMGGWLLRRMTPFVVGVPIVLGWLHILGEQQGCLENIFGMAVMMVIMLLLLGSVLWWLARTLSRIDIARRRAEAEVAHSAAEIRATLYDIGEGVITADAAGLITRMNPVAEQLTGWRECDALGHPVTAVFRIVDEITRAELENPVARILRERPVETLSDHPLLIARDGTARAIADSAAPIRGEQDTLVGVVLTFRDVSAERGAARELLASETRYRRLFESTKDGILILDAATGAIVDINPFLLAMVGYPQEEFVGKRIWEIGLFQEIIASEEAFAAFTRDDYLRYDDLPITTWEGRRIDVEFVSIMYPVDGTMVVQCNIREISERKRAEETLKRLNRALRAISDSNQALIHMTDETELLFHICHIVTEIGGYRMAWVGYAEQDDAKTVRPVAQSGYEAGYLETLKLTWADVERGRGPAGIAIRTGLPCICRNTLTDPRFAPWREDARERGYLSSLVLPMKCDGQAFGALNIYADKPDAFDAEEVELLTELADDLAYGLTALRTREAHEQAEEQRAALEAQMRQQQRLETVGQLAAGVAHDFNNLLTGITGFTQFAHDGMPEHSTARMDLAEVLALTRRAVDLTRQLLAFSRRQTLHSVVLDLNQLVSEMIKMLGRLIGEHIELVFRPAAGLGQVKADPGQIEQVLVNLAVNARDAMPDGGVLMIETAHVELDDAFADLHAGVKPGPYVLLLVTDTGCGMQASVREHVFEPFFTTKALGKGTGLGLATTYGIVKQHGGNIWVESEPGMGTTFKVYLPRVAETFITEAPAGAEALPTSMETILIVEDETSVREVAARILQARGYRVLTAALPSEAEQALAAHGDDIALLLTDVVMPERSGRQLYESVRAQFPLLRVLYMSGYSDDAIMHHSVLDANTAFIAKPFTADALARKVRAAMGSSKS